MLINPRPSDNAAAAHDRVYRALRTRIMHGEIAPGQALTLRGLAKTYGVSMTPAREALRRLVAEGALMLSSSGRVSTPELSNDRIEELAALRALVERRRLVVVVGPVAQRVERDGIGRDRWRRAG